MDLAQYLPLILMMIATGVVGGILAGLLGVGGGIVIVPVLDFALGVVDVDPAVRMHVAVATSLATIVPTSISSARAHHARGAVDLSLVKFWGPMVIFGALIGAWTASWVDGRWLSVVFGAIALLVALKMMFVSESLRLTDDVPRGVIGALPPLSIGGLSSWMGIGGGTLSVPVLTLMNQPVHRAVGTSALFGLLISVPATIGFVAAGWDDPRAPAFSFGYVNVLGFLLIAPLTVLSAPLGARIAHAFSKQQLSLAFGLFLFIVAARMLYASFVA